MVIKHLPQTTILAATVLPVGDVDVAVLIEGNAQGWLNSQDLAGAAVITDDLPSREKTCRRLLPLFDDDDVAFFSTAMPAGRSNHRLRCRSAPHSWIEIPAAVEHRDRIVHSSEQ